MLLRRLFSYSASVFLFSWIFTLSATIITIQTILYYITRMFDLPADVIHAMIETNKLHDSKDEKI